MALGNLKELFPLPHVQSHSSYSRAIRDFNGAWQSGVFVPHGKHWRLSYRNEFCCPRYWLETAATIPHDANRSTRIDAFDCIIFGLTYIPINFSHHLVTCGRNLLETKSVPGHEYMVVHKSDLDFIFMGLFHYTSSTVNNYKIITYDKFYNGKLGGIIRQYNKKYLKCGGQSCCHVSERMGVWSVNTVPINYKD